MAFKQDREAGSKLDNSSTFKNFLGNGGLVKVPKKEGQYGPKRIFNPEKKIYLDDPDNPTVMSKKDYIRKGIRKQDYKFTPQEIGGTLIAGSIVGGLLKNLNK